jgi:hypothetical protein
VVTSVPMMCHVCRYLIKPSYQRDCASVRLGRESEVSLLLVGIGEQIL